MTKELPSLEHELRAAAAIGTTQLLERTVILLLFAGLVLGVLAVLLPFATAILFGTILAIAAWPLRDFLLRRGLKRGLAATLLLLLALAIVALPLMAVAPGLAEHLAQGGRRLQAYLASTPQVPPGLAGLPVVGERLARIWDQAMLAEGGIRAVLEPYSDVLRQTFVGAAGALAASVLQIILSLVVAAMFWVSGDALAATLRDILRRLGGEATVAELDVAAGAVRGVAYGGGGNGRHPGRRDGDRPGRGGGSGRRLARLRHPAARAQPDRRTVDHSGLGRRGGLAVWPGPAGLGQFPDRLGPRRYHDGQCH
jgi:AI-2E family transporter